MAQRLEQSDSIRQLLTETRVLAIIGAKGPGKGPAYDVPLYLKEHGYDIRPIHPRETEILGESVHQSVAELDEPVDIVVLFRRSDAVPMHLDEILALDPPPRAVWMQLGIENETVADALIQAGIDVVQDRCMLIEHRRLIG